MFPGGQLLWGRDQAGGEWVLGRGMPPCLGWGCLAVNECLILQLSGVVREQGVLVAPHLQIGCWDQMGLPGMQKSAVRGQFSARGVRLAKPLCPQHPQTNQRDPQLKVQCCIEAAAAAAAAVVGCWRQMTTQS